MATTPQSPTQSEPFRWKLFALVMLIMGTLTAAAIILTLMANPTRGGVHAPSPQPISHVDFLFADHPNPVSAL